MSETTAAVGAHNSPVLTDRSGGGPRVAIVHDWMEGYSGSERVVEQMLHVLPHAELFVIADFIPESQRAFLGGRTVTTSFIQRLPGARRIFKKLLPVLTFAAESFDLSDYDVVVSSSHAVAKGVLTGPDQLHICMCYSPMRYAWDLQHQYLSEANLTHGLKSVIARAYLHYMRLWDSRTANGVDQFIAISEFIGRRIRKVYGRESTVIYPPVDVEGFALRKQKENFYLAASRLVPYKRMNIIVEAFNEMPEKTLVVIGDGPMMPELRAKAGSNVKLMGFQPFSVLRDHMQRAKAFVFAAEEDFGIALLEAQSCGTPAICYGRGGAVETVIANQTGIFFYKQTPAEIRDAVRTFEISGDFDPLLVRANAKRFSVDNFRVSFGEFFDRHYRSHRERIGLPI